MFVVYPDQLRYSAERIREEICLRNEAYEKIDSACRALNRMSSMDEQVSRLKQQLKGLENEISALCRMYSLIEEIRYTYEETEMRIVNEAEGVGEENTRIIRRQHIRRVVIPDNIRIVRMNR